MNESEEWTIFRLVLAILYLIAAIVALLDLYVWNP